ncbi:MAG: hypothetical protein H6964_14630 [Chromatiaceae bacterium]|nr:hypothetical protein [Chromatiaceae bacterium]
MSLLVCCADPDLTGRWLEGIGALDDVRCERQTYSILQLFVPSAQIDERESW